MTDLPSPSRRALLALLLGAWALRPAVVRADDDDDGDDDDDDDDDNSGPGGGGDDDDDDDEDWGGGSGGGGSGGNSGSGGGSGGGSGSPNRTRVRDISVRYADGWLERIVGGRYELIDNLGRLVVGRSATQEDFDRMLALR